MENDLHVAPQRACAHLLEAKDADFYRRFTGIGLEYELLCSSCQKLSAEVEPNIRHISPASFAEIEREGYWIGIIGQPEVRTRTCELRFEHDLFTLPELSSISILDIQPVLSMPNEWLVLSSDGTLHRIDLIHRSIRSGPKIPEGAVDLQENVMLRASRSSDLVAVANVFGPHGVVLDTETGQVTFSLNRGKYHEDISTFPLAFVELAGKDLLIHGSDWNRLDASDARTGKLLTERSPTAYEAEETRPPHYLDYFHCGLSVSPNQKFVADNGWCWAPCGIVATWSIPRWLQENVWESEDGPTKKYLCQRAYKWDAPLCWIDDQHLAVWGYGEDDEWLIPAARIFDVTTGSQIRWFPGPKGTLAFDEYLFSWASEGISVWDIVSGERLVIDNSLHPVGYHPGSKCFLSIEENGALKLSRLATRLGQAK